MDDIDIKLISTLRRNARISVTDLSTRLNVTRATVRSRLEKLLDRGEILGFTAILRGDAEDMPVRGVMLIEVEGKGTNRVIAHLDGMPTVQAIHTTNGRWDLIIELRTLGSDHRTGHADSCRSGRCPKEYPVNKRYHKQ